MRIALACLLLLSLLFPYTAANAADPLPSLKEIYADRFDFGTALPGNASQNMMIANLVCRQFSILTPENELKPSSVLDVPASKKLAQEDDTAVAVRFDAARNTLEFAQKNGIKVHGHTLVWHSQTPEAFFHVGYDSAKPFVTREVMLARLENYIRSVMAYLDENYPGLVVSWDVVNEAIDDGTGALRQSNWTAVVGEDFAARAFELARRYAPEGTLLYYNDYNTANLFKRTGIEKLLRSLIAEGNIDGYGFQMHLSVSSPTMDQLLTCVTRIAGLGLRLRVSELDIGVNGNTEADFAKQAEKYARVMKLFSKFADQIEAVQVWGLTDAMSWRAKEYPLLFDAAYHPKPAFYAVADPNSAL